MNLAPEPMGGDGDGGVVVDADEGESGSKGDLQTACVMFVQSNSIMLAV